MLCERSQGFVYGVNLLGVTGERAELADSSTVLAKRLKATTDLPVVMGFGIATPEQAVAAAAHADGVVVARRSCASASTAPAPSSSATASPPSAPPSTAADYAPPGGR